MSLIKNIGFNPVYAKKQKERKCYNIEVYSKQLWTYLEQFGRSSEKFIPREFLNLEPKYLERLLCGFIRGDSQNSKELLVMTSRSIYLIQALQEIILKLYGEIGQFTKRAGKYKDNDYTMYKLTLRKNKISRNNIKYGVPQRVDYDGKIYCLTLEKNNIMLVRRNGQLSFCGNCFREYVAQLMEYDKKFIVIGNQNAITYKEIFPLIGAGQIWLGNNNPPPKVFMSQTRLRGEEILARMKKVT